MQLSSTAVILPFTTTLPSPPPVTPPHLPSPVAHCTVVRKYTLHQISAFFSKEYSQNTQLIPQDLWNKLTARISFQYRLFHDLPSFKSQRNRQDERALGSSNHSPLLSRCQLVSNAFHLIIYTRQLFLYCNWGYFRSSCNSAERVKFCHSIMTGILSCVLTLK